MSRMSAARVVFVLLCAFGFGAYLSWNGWRGWVTGQILVRLKSGRDFVAYAAGPHASTFQTHVWLQIIGGAFLLVVCGGCIVASGLISPSRRDAMFAAGDAALTADIKRSFRWLLVVVLSALCVVALIALLERVT